MSEVESSAYTILSVWVVSFAIPSILDIPCHITPAPMLFIWSQVNVFFPCSVPPTSLLYGSRYDKIASAFGAIGYNAETVPELNQVLSTAFQDNTQRPVLINVVVHPNSSRKAQVCILHIFLVVSELFCCI